MAKAKEGYWYFTFGSGQLHAGHYIRLYGTASDTREKMIGQYGRQWAFQYSEKEWKDMKNDPNRWWPLEKPLRKEDAE